MTHHHRISRVAILMLVVGAIAVPSAQARFAQTDPAPCTSLCNGHGPGATPAEPIATPSIASANSGFDWGDAGIGAGVAIVIVATAAGGVVMVGRHHAYARTHHLVS